MTEVRKELYKKAGEFFFAKDLDALAIQKLLKKSEEDLDTSLTRLHKAAKDGSKQDNELQQQFDRLLAIRKETQRLRDAFIDAEVKRREASVDCEYVAKILKRTARYFTPL